MVNPHEKEDIGKSSTEPITPAASTLKEIGREAMLLNRLGIDVNPVHKTSERMSDGVIEIQKIPGMPDGFYNAAAFELNGTTYLLGRMVKEASKQGDPDVGTLVLLGLGPDGSVVSSLEVWRPEDPERYGDQLEDVRVIMTREGDLVMGCTRLAFDHEANEYKPFPAVTRVPGGALVSGRFPDTFHVKDFGQGYETTPIGHGNDRFELLSGKNVTPLKLNPDDEHNNFMFRQDSHNHILTIFSVDKDNQVTELQEVAFPEPRPEWGEARMGTTMPPVWLNKTEALFVIHGFKYVNGKPLYAIGTARLFIKEDGMYGVDNVSEEPTLTVAMLEAQYPGENVQLHPDERWAEYACGGIEHRNDQNEAETIDLYPSVGDTRTLKAVIDIKTITSKWKREDLVNQDTVAA